MDKLKTLTARKYYLLSCHKFLSIKGSEDFEESLVLVLTNNGGSICFRFYDESSQEEVVFDNSSSGEYNVPIKKGSKIKISIIAFKAIGAYKIAKKIVVK